MECRPRSRKRKSTVSGPLPSIPALNGLTHPRVHDSPKRRRSTSHQPLQANGTRLAAPLLFVTFLRSQPETISSRRSSTSADPFHNSSYLSRSAILGEDFPDIDHYHASGAVREHTVSPTDIEVLKLYHAFDLPPPALRQSLIEAYAKKCRTWMPVVNISSLSGSFAAGEDSLLLLQAVLLVGSLLRPELCTKETSDEYYRRVKALINAGYERDPLNILSALCLIQWYTPTSPKDISTDTPRFWASYALGLAQQMGLHKACSSRANDYELRRRIWWTLRARDNLMAAAHGRPRMLDSGDCTVESADVNDFEDPTDLKALIFVHYTKLLEILGDLCQMLTREGKISPQERTRVAVRLHDYIHELPDSLRLNEPDGTARPYNFELAQFHIPILITITILYRPRSIFSPGVANAASIVAANLSFRILQAIHFREHTKYLSSAFAWYGLATSIPHLSCIRIAKLKAEASAALDSIETVLSTLGKVRPSAANNLHNVRAIRRAVNAQNRSDIASHLGSDADHENHDVQDSHALTILQAYGPEIVDHYVSVVKALEETSSPTLSGEHHQTNVREEPDGDTIQLASPQESLIDVGISTPSNGAQDAFTSLFGEDLQGNLWMRDWMVDLQYMPE